MDRTGIITFKGAPMTLVGAELKVNDLAPDFTAINNDMQSIKLSSMSGKKIIISVVPSLDTPVCELQTKRFNEEAAKLDVHLVTISMDLPFAQRRFCESYKINNMIMLSDYKDRDFGNKYGLLIKELGLLARAVFIIDKDGRITYMQIVKEIGEQPRYDDVLQEVKKLG